MTKPKTAAPRGAASPAAPDEGAAATEGEVVGTVETAIASATGPLPDIGEGAEATALTETPIGGLAAGAPIIDEAAGFGLGGLVIRVRSVSAAGRRRAGMAFGPTPVPLRVDDLSEDQVAALAGDPELVVQLDD